MVWEDSLGECPSNKQQQQTDEISNIGIVDIKVVEGINSIEFIPPTGLVLFYLWGFCEKVEKNSNYTQHLDRNYKEPRPGAAEIDFPLGKHGHHYYEEDKPN